MTDEPLYPHEFDWHATVVESGETSDYESGDTIIGSSSRASLIETIRSLRESGTISDETVMAIERAV